METTVVYTIIETNSLVKWNNDTCEEFGTRTVTYHMEFESTIKWLTSMIYYPHTGTLPQRRSDTHEALSLRGAVSPPLGIEIDLETQIVRTYPIKKIHHSQ